MAKSKKTTFKYLKIYVDGSFRFDNYCREYKPTKPSQYYTKPALSVNKVIYELPYFSGDISKKIFLEEDFCKKTGLTIEDFFRGLLDEKYSIDVDYRLSYEDDVELELKVCEKNVIKESEKIKNVDYEKQLKKYEKDLEKYTKEKDIFESEKKIYEELLKKKKQFEKESKDLQEEIKKLNKKFDQEQSKAVKEVLDSFKNE